MATSALKDAASVAMLAEEDLGQARRFWRDALGMDEVQYDDGAQEAIFRTGAGTLFGVYRHQGGSSADHTELAFEVDDVRRTVQDLRQQGVTFEEYDLPDIKTYDAIAAMPGGGEAAWFKDPGNNIVGIFTLPRELARNFEPGMRISGRDIPAEEMRGEMTGD